MADLAGGATSRAGRTTTCHRTTVGVHSKERCVHSRGVPCDSQWKPNPPRNRVPPSRNSGETNAFFWEDGKTIWLWWIQVVVNYKPRRGKLWGHFFRATAMVDGPLVFPTILCQDLRSLSRICSKKFLWTDPWSRDSTKVTKGNLGSLDSSSCKHCEWLLIGALMVNNGLSLLTMVKVRSLLFLSNKPGSEVSTILRCFTLWNWWCRTCRLVCQKVFQECKCTLAWHWG